MKHLYYVVQIDTLNFDSIGKILKCEHSYESLQAVIYFDATGFSFFFAGNGFQSSTLVLAERKGLNSKVM